MHKGTTIVGVAALLGMASPSAGAQVMTTPPPPRPPYIGAPVAVPPPPSPRTGATGPTPVGNPGTWVTADDYPLAALRAEVQGTAAFRLDINSKGLVSGCTITNSSGSQELDTATCDLVTERARFEPGRDAQGLAIAGSYSTRIRWIIPDGSPDGPSQVVPSVSIETFFVETDGTATNCKSTSNGADVSASRRNSPCIGGERFAPFLDASGNPVRRKVTATMTVTVTDPNPKPAPRKKRHR